MEQDTWSHPGVGSSTLSHDGEMTVELRKPSTSIPRVVIMKAS